MRIFITISNAIIAFIAGLDRSNLDVNRGDVSRIISIIAITINVITTRGNIEDWYKGYI